MRDLGGGIRTVFVPKELVKDGMLSSPVLSIGIAKMVKHFEA